MDRLWMNYCKEWIIVRFLLLPVWEVKWWFMIELLPVLLGVTEDYEWAAGGNEVIKCESALFNVCLKTAGVWGWVWMSKVECVLCFQSSRRLKCEQRLLHCVDCAPFFLKSSFFISIHSPFHHVDSSNMCFTVCWKCQAECCTVWTTVLITSGPDCPCWGSLSLSLLFFVCWWSCHVSSGYSFFPSECCLVLGFERISKFTNLLVCCYVWELGKK